MRRSCAYVDWVTSCQELPSLSFAICQATLPTTTTPSPKIESHITHISSSRTYLLSLTSLLQLPYRLVTEVPLIFLGQRRASCLLLHLAITEKGYLISTLRRVSISVSLSSRRHILFTGPIPLPIFFPYVSTAGTC
jgi:hypothetical protein